MAQDRHSPRFARFGLFEADLLNGELRKSGLKIRLQGRPFEILQILLECPGDLVTRETFRQRLWPADTFVDFDHSLNASVSKLRQSLGDEAENPRFISTEGRRGYRFIAPVHQVDTSEPSPALSPEQSRRNEKNVVKETSAAKRNRTNLSLVWKLKALAAGAVVLLALFFVYRWFSPLPSPRVIRTTQLTTLGRADDWGGVSTDGVRVYFVEREGDHWNAVQTSINGGEALPIGPTFRNIKILDYSSRRSELLAGTFSMRWDGQMALWAIPVQGGALRRVGDLQAIDAVFAPDGEHIAYGTRDAIYVATKDGEGSRKLVSLESGPSGLRWSMDAKLLRFQLFDEKFGRFLLWEMRADGSDLHRVTMRMTGNDSAARGEWSSDGRYFFFTGMHDGMNGVWASNERGTFLHRANNEPFHLTPGATDFFDPVVSKDGKKLFALGGAITDLVMRYNLATKQLEIPFPWARPSGVISYAKEDRIAYVVGPSWELWRSKTDGSDRQKLTTTGLPVSKPAWSPDGKQIAFQATRSGEPARIYLIAASGGAPKEIPRTPGSQKEPSWSPDGKSLIFSVPPENGLATPEQSGIFQLDTVTGTTSKLPNSENLMAPSWSPNGRFIAAVTVDQHRLLVYDVSTRKWEEWAAGQLFGYLAWSSDSQFIYFQDVLNEQESLLRLHVPDRHVTRVAGCDVALRQGLQRCVFLGLVPDGSPLLSIRQNQYNVYAFDLEYR